MPGHLPVLTLVRHGETAWTLTGQHTGRTDIALTAAGEAQARQLELRLRGLDVALVLVSPLQRAQRTCELAGYRARAIIDPDLVEWDYGAYEGRRTVDILQERPGWNLFRDGCPDGESGSDVGIRAERVIARVLAQEGDALVFSSGHLLRVLAATWLGLEASAARLWVLDTASVSALGFDHDRSEPVIRLWNEHGLPGSRSG